MPTAQTYTRTTCLLGYSRVTSRSTGLFSRNCPRRAPFSSILARHITTTINAFDPKQTTNLSTKAASINAKKKRKVSPVVTLDPDNFHAAKQQMIDMSGKGWIHVGPKMVKIHYPSSPNAQTFLPGSHGYLYYRKPQPDEHELQGELRMRVVSSDAHSFDEGKDLEYLTGQPWKVGIFTMVHYQNYAPFVKTLLSDGIITQDLVNHIKKIPRQRIDHRSTILFSPSDTFVTNMETTPRNLRILCSEGLITMNHLPRSLFSSKSFPSKFMYKGVLRLRLERSPVSKNNKAFHMVFRVVDIIEPVVPIASKLNLEVAEPVEGELIQKKIPGTERCEPYIYQSRCSPSQLSIFENFFGDSNPFK